VLSLIGRAVGARFEDGRRVDEIPTEILGLDGRVRRGATGFHDLSLDLALIDASRNILRGRLARGDPSIFDHDTPRILSSTRSLSSVRRCPLAAPTAPG
jgi:hypothetical protein